MTITELRDKLKLKTGELISTNIGFIDLESVKDDIVTIRVLASGNTLKESIKSVILKLTDSHIGKGNKK